MPRLDSRVPQRPLPVKPEIQTLYGNGKLNVNPPKTQSKR